MNELDHMRHIWREQSIPPQPGPARQTDYSRLRAQMRHFEQENSPRYFLVMSIITGGLSILLLNRAWRSEDADGIWLGMIFLIGSLISGGQYWTGRNAPYPDTNLEAYLTHSRVRLLWRRRILAGGIVGMGLILVAMIWNQRENMATMDLGTKVGLGATVGIFGFVMAAFLWWQRHHGPYKVNEMEKLIVQMLDDLQYQESDD